MFGSETATNAGKLLSKRGMDATFPSYDAKESDIVLFIASLLAVSTKGNVSVQYQMRTFEGLKLRPNSPLHIYNLAVTSVSTHIERKQHRFNSQCFVFLMLLVMCFQCS